jgi:hypothetical protein
MKLALPGGVPLVQGVGPLRGHAGFGVKSRVADSCMVPMRKFRQATESEGEAFPFGRPALARGTRKRWVQATEHVLKKFSAG